MFFGAGLWDKHHTYVASHTCTFCSLFNLYLTPSRKNRDALRRGSLTSIYFFSVAFMQEIIFCNPCQAFVLLRGSRSYINFLYFIPAIKSGKIHQLCFGRIYNIATIISWLHCKVKYMFASRKPVNK